jgi:bis(5'-nucleosyl)-tetraphosphatase (symmetrical)
VADYAIGDLQGCYEPLQRLLQFINFDDSTDRLWFVGDLVNRGPDSLAVLRFVKSLVIKPYIALGNHDLHLLASLFGGKPWKGHDDSLQQVFDADDSDELGHWLRQQSILCYSKELNIVMCHAGIAPMWNLPQAISYAKELEAVLLGDDYSEFLSQMYGNTPLGWSNELQGLDRLRTITNYFTRMRFCDSHGQLDFNDKGNLAEAPPGLYPWYEVPDRQEIDADLVFGHWAALMGACPHPRIHALDTGCLWGGSLTALRLQDRHKFSIPCDTLGC